MRHSVSIEPDRPGDVHRRNLTSRRKKAAEPAGSVSGRKTGSPRGEGPNRPLLGAGKALEFNRQLECSLLPQIRAAVDFFIASFKNITSILNEPTHCPRR